MEGYGVSCWEYTQNEKGITEVILSTIKGSRRNIVQLSPSSNTMDEGNT